MANSAVATVKRDWEDLSHFDPLWAILARKEKQFGKWNREEFFASGQQEIDALMKVCGRGPGNNGRALDFGCGVGRLSRALRTYFAEVYGVDIAEEMIRLAREYTPSCIFSAHQADDLALYRDDFFDFVYSNMVLQHQPTKHMAKAYIREFIRVIRPGALVVFQMPFDRTLRHALRPKSRLYSLLRACGIPGGFLYNRLGLAPMRGISLPYQEVEETVSGEGGRILQSYRDAFNHYSRSYVVTKSQPAAGGVTSSLKKK